VSGTTRAVRMWCNNAFKRNEGRFDLKIMRLIRRVLLQLIDCERFLFDQVVPFDREALRAYRSLSMRAVHPTPILPGGQSQGLHHLKFQRPRDATLRRHASRRCEPGRRIRRAGSHVPVQACQNGR